jgi:shikimate dehydrogenase
VIIQRQAKIKRIYLLGYPLGHSISPAMHNAALQSCGLRGWRYEKLALPPDQMSAMQEALRAADCLGANVTIPYKQTIIPLLDELSATARQIGAVNTVVKRDGKLIGENTDAPGFLQSLREHRIHPRHALAIIFGAGGAAAAVAFALANAGARQLVIINRTATRGADLADRLNSCFPSLELAVNWWEPLSHANIIVNATAMGMAPQTDASPLPPGRTIPRGAVVFDLVYSPPETKLLREAANAGARCVGGLEMLIYQGAVSFQMWTGHEAPLPVMQAAAKHALRQPIRSSNAAILDGR